MQLKRSNAADDVAVWQEQEVWQLAEGPYAYAILLPMLGVPLDLSHNVSVAELQHATAGGEDVHKVQFLVASAYLSQALHTDD